MKLLGIDYGAKKVGLAISSGSLALPWRTLKVDSETVIPALKQIVQAESITGCIVGLPINLDGSHSQQTITVKNFCQDLKKQLSIPVEYVDERMSTQAAQRQGVADDDAQAAAFILQSYLDAQKNN